MKKLYKLPSIKEFVNESRKINETALEKPLKVFLIVHEKDGVLEYWDGTKFEIDPKDARIYVSRNEVESTLQKVEMRCKINGYANMPYIDEEVRYEI